MRRIPALRGRAASLSLSLFAALGAFAYAVRSPAGDAPMLPDVSITARTQTLSAREFRLEVALVGFPAMRWEPSGQIAVRWNPDELELVEIERASGLPASTPLTYVSNRELSQAGVAFGSEFAGASMVPTCVQPIFVIVFRVRGVFDESTVEVLGDWVFPPSPPGRTVILVASEWIAPHVVDGVLRLRPFQRGDTDEDGVLSVADAIRTLRDLFLADQAGGVDCADRADANDDGRVNVSDAVYLLRHLFAGGPRPPAPFSESGLDETADRLDCRPEPIECE